MAAYAQIPAASVPVSTEPTPAQAPPSGPSASSQERGSVARLLSIASRAMPTLLLAAVLCAITFGAAGGLQQEATTTVEILLTLGAGLVAAVAILLAPAGKRVDGSWPVILLFACVALSAVSVAWSVSPDASWQYTGRMLAYGALFGASVALVRAAPRQWNAVLGGVALSAVIVCGYALANKVLPAQLDPQETYARLQAPYEYWNATGLAAAMGIVACLWLGARRAGNAVLSALAYPATGLLMVTLMLAYSRGSLAVALVGAALWLIIVPLRLRGAVLLIVSGVCAGIVVAFDFSESALSSEEVPLAERVAAGHKLGVLLLAMLIVLAAIGIAIGFFTGRRAPAPVTRRRLGGLLIAMLLAGLLAGVGALSLTHRGLTGTISHDVSALTNPNAPVPANTPGRLTSAGSVRARYWKWAIEVFEEHPALGAGADGFATAHLRFQSPNVIVTHAHGYLVQTLADLGLAGIAITLALLIAWMIAAGAATHPLNRRWSKWRWTKAKLPYSPERIALLTMLCVVATFGVHSLEDWTWYVPGTACVALLCAGWLAGRGPLERPLAAGAPRWRHLRSGPVTRPRVAAAAVVVLAALLIAWVQWQPQRSASSSQEALALLPGEPQAALAAARTAVSRDPLSADARFALATVQSAMGRRLAARSTLQRAVKLQPSNPQTWLTLGRYDRSRNPKAAVRELRAALYLNPQSIPTQNEYVLALRAEKAAASVQGSRRGVAARTRLRSGGASRSQAGNGAPRGGRQRRRS